MLGQGQYWYKQPSHTLLEPQGPLLHSEDTTASPPAQAPL